MSGVYIHIPFCKSKCPYCDFYSYRCNDTQKDEYTNALIDEITTLRRCRKFIGDSFSGVDTLYLGGGTPSVLTGEQIERIIATAKEKFNISPDGEITVECNPSSDIDSLIPHLKKCGVNRISLGMQSAIDTERKVLGRTADKERIRYVINTLKENNINNISLDIMLGIPYQTKESIQETLDFAINCDVTHISAYILKIEENTFFGKNQDKFAFPDEDITCDLYNFCCEYLKKSGFNQYEISNFSKKGFESRHNTKYWELKDYLGIGAAAHSFVNGKRFYFEDDSQSFIDGNTPVFDGIGGDCDEYIMLGLRLTKGINIEKVEKLYGKNATEKIRKKAPFFKEKGLVNYDGKALSLTGNGFLISNSIIAELIGI